MFLMMKKKIMHTTFTVVIIVIVLSRNYFDCYFYVGLAFMAYASVHMYTCTSTHTCKKQRERGCLPVISLDLE